MTDVICPKCGGNNMHIIGFDGYPGNMESSESLSVSVYFGCEHCHPWLSDIGQTVFKDENGKSKLHKLYIETRKGVSFMEWSSGK